ncbi:MAG: hypothetical protein ACLFPF_07465 [Halanaerobiales bacterium]
MKKSMKTKDNKVADSHCRHENDNSNSNNSNVHNKFKFRKKMKKYISLRSPQEIDPEKVKIDIQKKPQERNKSSPTPNFIALTVLWAHYIAVQLGLLKDKLPSPWNISDEIEDGKMIERSRSLDVSPSKWKDFLGKVITDESWIQWIQNPDEVKQRTLLAFE